VALVGCTSEIFTKRSVAVVPDAPDFGKVPEILPRHIKGLNFSKQGFSSPYPEALIGDLIDIRKKYGIYASVYMSNEIFTQDGKYTSKPMMGEPLVLRARFYHANSGFSISDISGLLSFSTGKIISPKEIYMAKDSDYRGDISEDNKIYIESGENVRIDPKENVVVIFFEYPEPVPVENVFKVDFGNLVLADGRIIPFDAQFYPVVLEYQQSH
jgi:hypothetical protein